MKDENAGSSPSGRRLAAFALGLLLLVATVVGATARVAKTKQDKQREYLLHMADHEWIAKGCFELLTRHESEDPNDEHWDGDDPRLAGAIQALKLIGVHVRGDVVEIMMPMRSVRLIGSYYMGLQFQPRATNENQFDLFFVEQEDLENPILLWTTDK